MFSQSKADTICERLANGESLREICRDDDMPAESTVRTWALDDVAGFAAQYARAREIGYERLADEIIDISDRSESDTWTDGDGNVRTNQEVVARSRLMVDTRKWMLSKMLPKKYGEKVEHEHKGALNVTLSSGDESL